MSLATPYFETSCEFARVSSESIAMRRRRRWPKQILPSSVSHSARSSSRPTTSSLSVSSPTLRLPARRSITHSGDGRSRRTQTGICGRKVNPHWQLMRLQAQMLHVTMHARSQVTRQVMCLVFCVATSCAVSAPAVTPAASFTSGRRRCLLRRPRPLRRWLQWPLRPWWPR